MKKRLAGIAVAATTVLAFAGCGSSSGSSSTSTTAGHDKGTTATPVALCPAPTVAGLPTLTGLGASKACWDGGHNPAPKSTGKGVDYLPVVPGTGGSYRFMPVIFSAGLVSGWNEYFAAGTLRAVAQATVQEDLPSDGLPVGSGTLSGSSGDTCQYTNYRSRSLGTALAGDAAGYFSVEYTTATDNGMTPAPYDSQNVTGAVVSTTPAKPGDTC